MRFPGIEKPHLVGGAISDYLERMQDKEPNARQQMIEYAIGAAIVIPIGIWLKQSGTWAAWMQALFG